MHCRALPPGISGLAVAGAPAIQVRGVRRTFDAELAPVRALRGADFAEFVAVMGASGCGKATLLNIIAGLDLPDEGTVEVAGERVGGRNEVLELFRRLHEDGQTIVMVTHSAAVAAGADRIARMRDGRVAEPACGLPLPGCAWTRGGAGAR